MQKELFQIERMLNVYYLTGAGCMEFKLSTGLIPCKMKKHTNCPFPISNIIQSTQCEISTFTAFNVS